METTATAPINLRYEDIEPGTQFESAAHTVTPADIAAFADVTRDHHPLHVERYLREIPRLPGSDRAWAVWPVTDGRAEVGVEAL